MEAITTKGLTIVEGDAQVAHRLQAKDLSYQENEAVYGRCHRKGGHGHSWEFRVAARSSVPQHVLEKIVKREIEGTFDHRNLNKDYSCPEMAEHNPSGENFAYVSLVILIRAMLREGLNPHDLVSFSVFETKTGEMFISLEKQPEIVDEIIQLADKDLKDASPHIRRKKQGKAETTDADVPVVPSCHCETVTPVSDLPYEERKAKIEEEWRLTSERAERTGPLASIRKALVFYSNASEVSEALTDERRPLTREEPLGTHYFKLYLELEDKLDVRRSMVENLSTMKLTMMRALDLVDEVDRTTGADVSKFAVFSDENAKVLRERIAQEMQRRYMNPDSIKRVILEEVRVDRLKDKHGNTVELVPTHKRIFC
jgi:6-pyruvoyltetrahydropterin/6-carboxytetrahydropterin synthase